MGGGYKTINAATMLGPLYEGILVPKEVLDKVKYDVETCKEKNRIAKENEKLDGNGSECTVQLKNVDPFLYTLFDVDLLNKAIRLDFGDDEDYDNPHSWAPGTIYTQEVLDLNKKLHNELRAKHYAQPLEYTPEIHPVAHAYAIKMAKKCAEGYPLDHNVEELRPRRWSENLYMTQSDFNGRPPAKIVQKAIEGWYAENEQFRHYGEANPDVEHPLTGHFTALVWRDSQKMHLGLGRYTHPLTNKTTYVCVVNYNPAGNIENAFATNVLREGSFTGRENELPDPGSSSSNKMLFAKEADMPFAGLFGR
ncbi:hypothetical protein WDU94_010088 [Cyamophila willieti]